MKSIEYMKSFFADNLFDFFDGSITLKQKELIKTEKDSNSLMTFCEMLGLKDSFEKDGERPRFLPEGKLFKETGMMIDKLFMRLEEKNEELCACSKWLSDHGFGADVKQ